MKKKKKTKPNGKQQPGNYLQHLKMYKHEGMFCVKGDNNSRFKGHRAHAVPPPRVRATTAIIAVGTCSVGRSPRARRKSKYKQ